MRVPSQILLGLLICSSILGVGIYANYDRIHSAKIGVFDDEWRCPYCYHWAPRGEKCGNPKCPSKY